VKSPAELALLEAAGAAADRVFAQIVTRPFAGRTELDVSEEIADLLKGEGVHGEGFSIVGAGPNSASPHHHAGSRVIQEGDAVVLDFGGPLQGYYCDITRTVFVGSAPESNSEAERVYNLVQAAQEAAVRAALPGMTCEQLDAVARDLISEAGYGQYFMHRLGHGIGLDGHEPPYLVHGNATTLQAGMSFSIEPGIYLPGRFGVRIEDTVYLTDQGAIRCNHAPRELTVVG
jgi:Xaa-Pro aminopeptidase